MTTLCFVDIETTSLARPFSATPGEVWEVGLIVRGENDLGDPYEIERTWMLPVTLEHADPVSLDIGRFHDRHPQGDRYLGPSGHLTRIDAFAHELGELTDGAHLVGNVVSFDEERLAAILVAHGFDQMPWHYHLVDVEALAAGWLSTEQATLGAARPPWDSQVLADALGVEIPSAEDRHTALGDARWARDLYDAVMGTRSPQ